MRTVSALGLVLKVRVGVWKLLKACGQHAEYQACLEGKGEKKSENLVSRSPLEKPDTQTSLVKEVSYFATIILNNGTVV